MTANDARNLVSKCTQYGDALNHAINVLEEKITANSSMGRRECIVSFHWYPDPYKNFVDKYGKDAQYRTYNVEQGIREYFSNNGFVFKYVTDDICGGVRQDPYWTINW